MSNIKIKVKYNPNKGFYQIQDSIGGIELSSSVKIQRMAYYHTTKTENYSIGEESVIFGDAANGSITFTLPSAEIYDGVTFHIKK